MESIEQEFPVMLFLSDILLKRFLRIPVLSSDTLVNERVNINGESSETKTYRFLIVSSSTYSSCVFDIKTKKVAL